MIPDILQVTKNNENFLLYDSGTQDKERFLIFGTTQNLKLIENYKNKKVITN